MKTIHSDFRQFCFDNFNNNEVVANKVCNFYRKHIKVRGVKSSLDTKKKNIKAILENYNEHSLIEVIDHFLDMERRGTLTELTLPYFEKCVENNYNKVQSKVKTNTSTSTSNKKISKHIIPEGPKKSDKVLTPIIDGQINFPIQTDIPIYENFSFYCPQCNSALFTDLKICTNCMSEISYDSVDFSNYIQ